jgi:hypothetical protein
MKKTKWFVRKWNENCGHLKKYTDKWIKHIFFAVGQIDCGNKGRQIWWKKKRYIKLSELIYFRKEKEPRTLEPVKPEEFCKVSKIYVDNHDDQQDLFRRLLSSLWRTPHGQFEKQWFSTGYRVAIKHSYRFYKKKRSTKYMGISTLSRRKRMIQKLRSQINIFYKLFKWKK